MEEEKKRILNLVKEGKLTVEEALILLDELGKQGEAAKKKEEALKYELSTIVQSEERSRHESAAGEKTQSAKEKIFEFLDTAIQRLKDFDLDFNFGKFVDITHIFQQNNVYLKDLDIDIANGSVKLVPWDEKNVRIECDAKVYRVDTAEEARDLFLRDVLFSVEGKRMRFICQQKRMKVNATAYIPKEDYENVRIRLFNGPIETGTGRRRIPRQNGERKSCIWPAFDAMKWKPPTAKIGVNNVIAEESMETSTDWSCAKEALKADLQSFNGDIECSLADETLNL